MYIYLCMLLYLGILLFSRNLVAHLEIERLNNKKTEMNKINTTCHPSLADLC